MPGSHIEIVFYLSLRCGFESRGSFKPGESDMTSFAMRSTEESYLLRG